LAEWLRASGHDVLESRLLGPDPGDLALLQRAAHEKRILITIDTDFGALIFANNVSHCGLVRLPDVSAEKRILIFKEIFARHASDLDAGAIVTVRGNRIRVSRTLGERQRGNAGGYQPITMFDSIALRERSRSAPVCCM
jgi:predicted nuclease of predicted toxin-antitoxin system